MSAAWYYWDSYRQQGNAWVMISSLMDYLTEDQARQHGVKFFKESAMTVELARAFKYDGSGWVRL